MHNDPFKNFDRDFNIMNKMFWVFFSVVGVFIAAVFIAALFITVISTLVYTATHPKQVAAAVGEMAGTAARSADGAYRGQ